MNDTLACMTYEETLDYLFNQLPMYQRIGKAAYKADLTTTLQLDSYFNHPHTSFKSIHVAGTNGKGSTSHMLAAVLQQAGYKVGLYTSPHLKDFRERIRINGEPIGKQEVVDFVEQHRGIFEELQPSFFEMTAALAFYHFAREKVDVAVVEVGMGGRLDSTNIIHPLLSIITNIGLDHTEFLGDTIEKIAAEKAGIIKPDTPVVVGEWNEESAPVFDSLATEAKAPVVYADWLLSVQGSSLSNGRQCFDVRVPLSFAFQAERYCVDLLGGYQQKNLLTVLAALDYLQELNLLNISQEDITEGLLNAARTTGLQGRWQVLATNPLCICDTGHNAHGLHWSMSQLRQLPYVNLYVVLGVVGDKDLESIIPLLPTDAYYFFTRADLPRSMDAAALAEKCMAQGLKGEVINTVPEAYAEAKRRATKDDVIFVGGSTFVVAEVL